jgi:NitT/TauT family transport system substrate-binding protein
MPRLRARQFGRLTNPLAVVSGDIKTLQDLKGKTVGAEPGLPPHFVLMYLLFKNGMSLSDINLKDMTTQDAASAFAGGKLDGAGIYEPYLTTAKQQRPGSRVVISSAQTPGLIVDLIFARADAISKHPDAIKTVIAGWHKAMAFIKTNPDAAYPIMAKAFDLPINEFKDTVSGIKWLDLDDNKRLFGTKEAPGPLVHNFGVVVDVLKRNRPSVYPSVGCK